MFSVLMLYRRLALLGLVFGTLPSLEAAGTSGKVRYLQYRCRSALRDFKSESEAKLFQLKERIISSKFSLPPWKQYRRELERWGENFDSSRIPPSPKMISDQDFQRLKKSLEFNLPRTSQNLLESINQSGRKHLMGVLGVIHPQISILNIDRLLKSKDRPELKTETKKMAELIQTEIHEALDPRIVWEAIQKHPFLIAHPEILEELKSYNRVEQAMTSEKEQVDFHFFGYPLFGLNEFSGHTVGKVVRSSRSSLLTYLVTSRSLKLMQSQFSWVNKDLLSLFKGKRVLDAPAGGGQLVRDLRRNGVEAFGIDWLSMKNPKEKSDEPWIFSRDMTETKFPDESFDYILSSYGPFTYENDLLILKPILKELARILKKGGEIIIVGRSESLPIDLLTDLPLTEEELWNHWSGDTTIFRFKKK